MQVKVLQRFIDKKVVYYPGQTINISSEKAMKLIRRRIAKSLDGEVPPFGTTAEYAEAMLKQRVKDRGCCPERIGGNG